MDNRSVIKIKLSVNVTDLMASRVARLLTSFSYYSHHHHSHHHHYHHLYDFVFLACSHLRVTRLEPAISLVAELSLIPLGW
jgi:hypothetical protein